MSIYSSRRMRNAVIYTKDGRPVKKIHVPVQVFNELEAGKESVDDSTLELGSTVKACLFCGATCKNTRFVNQQTVYLCEQHFYDKNIGQIAQALREKYVAV